MNDKRATNAAHQIQRLADLAHANGLVVSVAPFDDRGAALVITDPLDASGPTVLMPARLAAALFELIEGEPAPSFSGSVRASPIRARVPPGSRPNHRSRTMMDLRDRHRLQQDVGDASNGEGRRPHRRLLPTLHVPFYVAVVNG